MTRWHRSLAVLQLRVTRAAHSQVKHAPAARIILESSGEDEWWSTEQDMETWMS